MSERVIQNWIFLAEYDLETAHMILKNGMYLYVPFYCQQTIEKYLKAVYVKEKVETPPHTHNLIKLMEHTSFLSSMNKRQRRFIEDLNSYYVETRYTENFQQLMEVLTEDTAEKMV